MTQPAAMIGHHTPLMPEPNRHGRTPEYKLYRARPRLLQRGRDDGSMLDELRGAPPGAPPQRRRRDHRRPRRQVARARGRRRGSCCRSSSSSSARRSSRTRCPAPAQAQLDRRRRRARRAADDPRPRLRPAPAGHEGARREHVGGPSRSDTILLLRIGGGHSAQLSIPRDTVVDIPGHGRDKINAAYAYRRRRRSRSRRSSSTSGSRSTTSSMVNFANFPALIDAMGGDRLHRRLRRLAHQRRLRERRLHAAPAGGHAPHRRQAGARARPHAQERAATRARTTCTRARRQQKILAAMKSARALARRASSACRGSPGTRRRRSRPTWAARALLGLRDRPRAERQRPDRGPQADRAAMTLPDGGAGLDVSDAEKQAEVQRFLR